VPSRRQALAVERRGKAREPAARVHADPGHLRLCHGFRVPYDALRKNSPDPCLAQGTGQYDQTVIGRGRPTEIDGNAGNKEPIAGFTQLWDGDTVVGEVCVAGKLQVVQVVGIVDVTVA